MTHSVASRRHWCGCRRSTTSNQRPPRRCSSGRSAAELDVARGRRGRFGQGVMFGPIASASATTWMPSSSSGRPRECFRCLAGTMPCCRSGPYPLAGSTGVEVGSTRSPTSGLPRDAGIGARRWTNVGDATRLAAFEQAHPPVTMVARQCDRSSPATPSTRPISPESAHRSSKRSDRSPAGSPTATTPRPSTSVIWSRVDRRDVGPAHLHPLASLVGTGLRLQVERASERFTVYDGNLAGFDTQIGDRAVSPSRLETWAACGFRYFLKYILEVTDRDDPERTDEISALDRGSLIHMVLERFIAEAIERGAPEPDTSWSDDRPGPPACHRRRRREDVRRHRSHGAGGELAGEARRPARAARHVHRGR